MQLSNIYSQSGSQTLINRINQLTPSTAAQWGKMNVAQMMAHCNVSFEMAHNDNFKKSSPFLRFILKNLVKGGLVQCNLSLLIFCIFASHFDKPNGEATY